MHSSAAVGFPADRNRVRKDSKTCCLQTWKPEFPHLYWMEALLAKSRSTVWYTWFHASLNLLHHQKPHQKKQLHYFSGLLCRYEPHRLCKLKPPQPGEAGKCWDKGKQQRFLTAGLLVFCQTCCTFPSVCLRTQGNTALFLICYWSAKWHRERHVVYRCSSN